MIETEYISTQGQSITLTYPRYSTPNLDGKTLQEVKDFTTIKNTAQQAAVTYNHDLRTKDDTISATALKHSQDEYNSMSTPTQMHTSLITPKYMWNPYLKLSQQKVLLWSVTELHNQLKLIKAAIIDNNKYNKDIETQSNEWRSRRNVLINIQIPVDLDSSVTVTTPYPTHISYTIQSLRTTTLTEIEKLITSQQNIKVSAEKHNNEVTTKKLNKVKDHLITEVPAITLSTPLIITAR